MSISSLQRLILGPFNGLNQKVAHKHIGQNETYEARNFYTGRGSLDAIPVPSEFPLDTSTSFEYIMAIEAQGASYKQYFLLVATNGVVYAVHYNTVSEAYELAAISGGDLDVDHLTDITYVNYVYNGVSIVIYSDGVTTPVLWNGTVAVSLTDLDAEITMRDLTLYKERIFALGSGPNTVYHSDDWNPTNWTPALGEGGAVQVQTGDSDTCTAIITALDRLYVFKRESIHQIYGDSDANFVLTGTYAKHGTISSQSLAIGRSRIYYLAEDGVYYFDGNYDKKIGDFAKDDISRIMKQNPVISAAYYDEKYFLALKGDSENLVYVYDELKDRTYLQNITRFPVSMASTLIFDDTFDFERSELLYVDGTNAEPTENNVLSIEATDYEDTSLVRDNFYWYTKEIDFGDILRDKYVHNIIVVAESNDPSRLYMTVSVDGVDYDEVSFDFETARFQESGVPMRGHQFRFKFSNKSGDDGPYYMKIYEIIIEYRMEDNR